MLPTQPPGRSGAPQDLNTSQDNALSQQSGSQTLDRTRLQLSRQSSDDNRFSFFPQLGRRSQSSEYGLASKLARQDSFTSDVFRQERCVLKLATPERAKHYEQLLRKYNANVQDKLEKSRPCYFVLDDAPQNVGHRTAIEKAQREHNSYLQVRIVSSRWIDYCIETKKFISDPLSENLLQLLPINFATPFDAFRNLTLYYDQGTDKVNSQKSKGTIEKIVKVLGAQWKFCRYQR